MDVLDPLPPKPPLLPARAARRAPPREAAADLTMPSQRARPVRSRMPSRTPRKSNLRDDGKAEPPKEEKPAKKKRRQNRRS